MTKYMSILALGLLASRAQASPWTLPKGHIAAVANYDFEIATKEFLDNSDPVVFPLNGAFRASTYTLATRMGVSDRFELGFSIPLRQVAYNSDPVILLPTDQTGGEAFDYYQKNVLDLSRAVTGIGDLRLSGRYQFIGGSIALASELGLKIPTGYSKPAGTFGNQPRSRTEFLKRVVELTKPENVADDVTLGDGQVDATAKLLFGWAFSAGTFIRVDTGYALRLGGAGDQALGSVRVGQLIAQRVLIYGGVDGVKTVTDADVIGISVAATDPTLPAADYKGLENLVPREVRLKRDRLAVAVGGIIRITSEVELNVGYHQTVWGQNTSLVQGVSVGVGLRTDVFAD